METKTKIRGNAADTIQNQPDGPLTYQKSQDSWGLCAYYKSLKLTFSGEFSQSAVQKRKWQKIFGPFKFQSQSGPQTKSVDVYSLFSQSAQDAWNRAYVLARHRRSNVGLEDIFLSLLDEPSVQNLLARTKASAAAAESFLKNYLLLNPEADTQTTQSGSAIVSKLPFEAFSLAVKLKGKKIGSLMLLGAVLKSAPKDNILQAIFSNIGLTMEKFELLAIWAINLPYDFPPRSPAWKLLYCCHQSEALEAHFGWFFEFPAIEAAVNLSSGQSLKDLQHKKALQLLVKAGRLAQDKGTKVVSESLVGKAAG